MKGVNMVMVDLNKKELFKVIWYIEECLGDLEDKIEKNMSEGRHDDNYALYDELGALEFRYKELCKLHDECE